MPPPESARREGEPSRETLGIRAGRNLALLFLAGLLVSGGRGGMWTPGGEPPPGSPYAVPTAPESLLVNLQVAYSMRQIEGYAGLLAPEFSFRPQSQDAAQFGTEFWTREEDSLLTQALFEDLGVDAIRIELLGLPEEPSTEPGHPAGAMKIRIATTDLQVDQVDGITWVVSDEQDMYFRRGLEAAGEDTTRWFLFEWRDLSTPGAIGADHSSSSAVMTTTWGQLKGRYGSPTPSRPTTWGALKVSFLEPRPR